MPSLEVRPRDMVSAGLCIGCGVCAARGGGAMRFDRYGQLKPHGASDPAFAASCPFSPFAADEDAIAAGRFPAAPRHHKSIGRYEGAYVGHVAAEDFRTQGSSGGLVSWMASELLRRGLIDGVAHVAPADRGKDGRLFRYRISRSQAEVRQGAKSRYYPVELSEVVREIRAVPGRYAVVGIPCFVKAVNLLRAEDEMIRERVAFTLGLFCGHMKSARMAESFALQMGAAPEDMTGLDFRVKDERRPANWYRAEVRLADGSSRAQDWWHLVDGDWGAGFFQNSACNYCDDVVAETADISFGDAWLEPYSSDGRGTNVVVVRSPVLHDLVKRAIADGRLALSAVDAEFVHETQAAGFRQRREGMAWRLARRRGLKPVKRFASAESPPARRRLIYWMRMHISRWSHRMFWLARRLDRPGLYTRWAGAAAAVYHGLAYSRGALGDMMDRVERLMGRSARPARGSGSR